MAVLDVIIRVLSLFVYLLATIALLQDYRRFKSGLSVVAAAVAGLLLLITLCGPLGALVE